MKLKRVNSRSTENVKIGETVDRIELWFGDTENSDNCSFFTNPWRD